MPKLRLDVTDMKPNMDAVYAAIERQVGHKKCHCLRCDMTYYMLSVLWQYGVLQYDVEFVE